MTLARLTHQLVEGPGPAPRKLVLVLHGRGDSMDGFAWLPRTLALPGFDFLFLNAPDDYFGGFSWYDLPPNQAPGVLRSRALLMGVLDDLIAQGHASTDLLIFGFSQGCLMAIDVGLRYPQPLGGICGVSGYVLFPERAADEATPHAKAMPWLITHGLADEVVPCGPTEQHVQTLKAAGIPIDWQVFDKGHEIEPTREWRVIRNWFAARTP